MANKFFLFLALLLFLPVFSSAMASEKTIEFSLIYSKELPIVGVMDAKLFECNQPCDSFSEIKNFFCTSQYCYAEVGSFALLYKLEMRFSDSEKKRSSQLFQNNEKPYSDLMFSSHPNTITFDVTVTEDALEVRNTTFYFNLWRIARSLAVIFVLAVLSEVLAVFSLKFFLKKTVSIRQGAYIFICLLILLILLWMIL